MAKRITVKVMLTVHDQLTREYLTDRLKKMLVEVFPHGEARVRIEQEDKL